MSRPPAAAVLRAWWSEKQGLSGSGECAGAAATLARAGWARSVGGAAPYLTLFARSSLPRSAADDALARLEIHELPSARGCTYVVPADDHSLALAVGRPFAGAEMALARKLGVADAEVDRLCAAVIDALGAGPLDPDGIRAAVGPAVRSLGEEGRKKGLSSTLPLALDRLQAEGEIRRVPVDGRLDRQRYRYALWRPKPAAFPGEPFTELARRYFAWIGPARVSEFQWFSGLGARAAKQAVEPLGLVPLAAGDDRLLFPADRDALLSFSPPRDPRYALVSSLDGIALLRRNPAELIDPADAAREVLTDKAKKALGGLADLPSHAILDRGRVAGLWEYDAESGSVAWAAFVEPDAALKEAVRRTEAFIREDLGDARAFSLDTPKSRASRIACLRDIIPPTCPPSTAIS